MTQEQLVDRVVQAMLKTIIPETPTDDPEYVWAQWAGTALLMEQAHDWSRLARDESLMDGVRVFAAERARAIREEIAP
jgi:hypothetical protein